MATKVKPSRLQVSGTPQVGQVPVYVDEDTFQWGAGGGGGGGDVFGPASSTDGDIVLFDGATGKVIKDSGVGLSSKLDATALSNNAYGGGWNGDTTHTPTKDALYDKIHTMDVEIGNKAADTSVVKLTGNQTIAGTKTFSTSPVVPSKTTDATNTGTAIATEAQVYKVDSKVSALFGLGKFLSLWNATTGLPVSFPLSTPYTYSTGDYYLVETVSSATPPVNYKPTGSSYSGTASSVTESEELAAGDIYIYDGSTWLLQLNHGKTVSFSEIAGDPYDNTDLSTALGAKQDELVSDVNIRTINGTSILGSGDITTPVGPTYTAGTGISINSSDEISNSQPGPAVSSSAPASPSQGAMWYDTTNDELKTYDGSNWNTTGGGITKIFTLSSTSDLVTAQAAHDYFINGGNPVIRLGNYTYTRGSYGAGGLSFFYIYPAGVVSAGSYWSSFYGLNFVLSSGVVTSITEKTNRILLRSSAPTTGDNSTITLVI